MSKLLSAILLLPISALGFAAENYEVPRTEWGLPDLQGVWNFSSQTPMLRPSQYGNRQYLTDEEVTELQSRTNAGLGSAQLTSHIIYPTNGRLPPLQENAFRTNFVEIPERPVRAALGINFGTDGPEDRPLSDRCILGFNAGPPVTPSFYNNNLQIVQNKDHVVIITEMVHETRVVPLGNSDYVPEEIGLWAGDSRGFWEGDTLVVETKNFNGLTNTFSMFGTSENKHLTEKFTRITHDQINYEFTIEDPNTFTDKIVGLIPIYKVAGQIYEYACHEGNYGMVNILRGARVQEQMEESE